MRICWPQSAETATYVGTVTKVAGGWRKLERGTGVESDSKRQLKNLQSTDGTVRTR